MLSWFSSKHVDAFADSIVAELLERFPPTGIELSTEKSAERAMKNLERILSLIGVFAAEHRPGLYQKARFGNRIKWALKEAGYPPSVVELITHEVVAKMALATRTRRPSR
ncbi:MAG TPA: hypothetical protein VEX61_06825 [Burkholderiales bacterium]|nr:hypothetical protein [Burkholderiales bacterium]